MSNARSLSSIAAAMKTRPPAVTIEPPKLIDPNSADFGNSVSCGMPPSGASHRISPVFRSTAFSLPQGGATQGVPLGDHSGSRYMAYGAPDCGPNSLPSLLTAPVSRIASYSARGMSLTRNGTLLVLVISNWRTGSKDIPLQFMPPALPGTATVPSRLGGV